VKPKKQDSTIVIIAAVALVFTVFLAVHGAGAYVDVQADAGFEFGAFLNALEVRTNEPFDIEMNDYSMTFLFWGGFVWFVTVAYITTNKKNTIAGKEHGTAKWGTQSDIRDLFAENVLKEEIKKVTKAKFFVTRWFAKRKVFKQAERDGRSILNEKMEALEEAEEINRDRGTYNKNSHNAKKNEIHNEVKELVRKIKIEAWKPLKLKEIYDTEVLSLNDSKSHGYISESVYMDRLSRAKQEYERNLKAFYYSKGQIKVLKKTYKDADTLFTATEKASIFNYKINNNVLILGGSGSGKTRGFVMPNILQAHSSYVVTDPKGEILEKSGYFLTEHKGYTLRVLNLDNKSQSDGYNPFVYIHPEREGYDERTLMLIEAIILNTDGGEKRNSSDPFWEKAERLFLQAIFFFTCDGFPIQERNMNTVLDLIGMLQIGEEEDDLNSDLDLFARVFAKRFGEDHIGVQQYNEFRSKASGKTAKSIVISAVARLAPFRTSAVRRIFSYDSMNLEMLGEQKMAIFVVVPPTDNTFNFIAGMLFTQMFQELQYCAAEKYKHKGQRLPVPVRFILDEFANTCKIPNFIKILAYARSFGIGIVPILQSLEQIKTMYKDEWGVVVDNCSARLFLGSISHMDTLEYMSKMLGKGTYDKMTTGRTRSKQGSTSKNWDVIGRELMDAAEIGKLPKEDCLLLISGRKPFYSKKYDYIGHANYRYTSDGNKAYSFDYTPLINPFEYEQNARNQNDDDDEYEEMIDEEVEIAQDDFDFAETDRIELCTDPQTILENLTDENSKIMPIPDEFLRPDFGEIEKYSDEEAQMLIELLADNENEEENFEFISSLSERVALKTDLLEIAASAVEAYDSGMLRPIPDTLVSPDFGETEIYTDEETDMIIEAIEEPEYEMLERELLSNVENVTNLLNGLIDALPSDMTDMAMTQDFEPVLAPA